MKSSEQQFKSLLREFLDETEDAIGICSDDQGQFCIYCDYYSSSLIQTPRLGDHDDTCLLVRTSRALAASERTDLERLREWMEGLVGEYKLADMGPRVPVLERILAYLNHEFGVGEEGDAE